MNILQDIHFFDLETPSIEHRDNHVLHVVTMFLISAFGSYEQKSPSATPSFLPIIPVAQEFKNLFMP